MVEVIKGHFESEENHWLDEGHPDSFIFSFELEVFHSFRNHQEHLFLGGEVDLDRVHSPKDTPITEMQEDSNKLHILVTFDEFEHFIDVVLREGNIDILLLGFLVFALNPLVFSRFESIDFVSNVVFLLFEVLLDGKKRRKTIN